MSRRDIYLSPEGDPTMYILTHKQSKGISSITEYEKLSILRNWRNKTLAVNSFKYRTIKGGGGRGGYPKDHFRSQGGEGGSGEGLIVIMRYLKQPRNTWTKRKKRERESQWPG